MKVLPLMLPISSFVGTLPEALYRHAVDTFGQQGTNEMIYLVGLYCLVSTTLNGFNVPVPERE
jgi:4-carboxymuconolactone decarboxylase